MFIYICATKNTARHNKRQHQRDNRVKNGCRHRASARCRMQRERVTVVNTPHRSLELEHNLSAGCVLARCRRAGRIARHDARVQTKARECAARRHDTSFSDFPPAGCCVNVKIFSVSVVRVPGMRVRIGLMTNNLHRYTNYYIHIQKKISTQIFISHYR